MKKFHLFFNLLLAIMLLPTIAACDKDNGGNDAIAIAPFDFMIKFESPMGTNILDSLQIQPTNEKEGNQLGDLTFKWTNKNPAISNYTLLYLSKSPAQNCPISKHSISKGNQSSRLVALYFNVQVL